MVKKYNVAFIYKLKIKMSLGNCWDVQYKRNLLSLGEKGTD